MMMVSKLNALTAPIVGYVTSFFGGLKRDQCGLALTEFALSIPIFTGLGMYGMETAYRAVAQTQVSQAALALADNASRMGQTGTSGIQPTIQESDVIEALVGTRLQTENLELLENGRVILSSLEVKRIASEGNRQQQYIRWMRCKGVQPYTSSYISGLNTSDDEFTGVGPTGAVRAVEGSAVMYVEVIYNYPGLFGDLFAKNVVMSQEAAFTIRDERNLAGELNNDVGVANQPLCNKFDAT